MKLTESEGLANFRCIGCRKSDQLYRDDHGVFCARCGPSTPVGRATAVVPFRATPAALEGRDNG